ncbi:class IV adenylate cyclase [Pseudorhodoferax sp.]|uniref:class IV adenylate cyclase n=1 Tax=Pseudorhodoferax sp. TaxID=1993553 RepID=UPI002DD61C2C|nr:class IV adenylate cyclase [Pseudorhodoferax sp.]
MARNIEIKARIASIEAVLPRARALADGEPVPLAQVDTFFHATHGRLKLRQSGDGQAELIHYQRADGPEARASDYVRVPVAEPALLALALARAHGERGQVHKIRWLLHAGQTRIHLDRVRDLGDFIELEVVLHPGQTDAQGRLIADALMQRLGLAEAPRLAVAYIDLLPADGAQQTVTG